MPAPVLLLVVWLALVAATIRQYWEHLKLLAAAAIFVSLLMSFVVILGSNYVYQGLRQGNPVCLLTLELAPPPGHGSEELSRISSEVDEPVVTWPFASPDGRATFQLVTVPGELRCRWRRIGDHDVFKEP